MKDTYRDYKLVFFSNHALRYEKKMEQEMSKSLQKHAQFSICRI